MDKAIPKRKRKKFLLAGLAAGTGLVILTVLLLSSSANSLRVEKSRLTIATVEFGAFQEHIAVTGIVMPEKTMMLDAGEGGKVEEIYTESGQIVKMGDPVLKLSNNTLQMNLINREADILEQINTLRNTKIVVEEKSLNLREQLIETDYAFTLARKNYDRQKILYSKGVIAKAEFDPIDEEFHYLQKKKAVIEEKLKKDSTLSKYQLSNIDPSLELMSKNLDFIEKSLDNLIIRAPIDGQLSSLNVEYGQSVQAGQPVGQIDVWNGMKVRVEVDEFYLSRVMIGQKGSYNFNGQEYVLDVIKVFPEVTGGKFRVDMIFHDSAPQGIRRGQTLPIRLALGEKSKALQVAKGGFYSHTGGNWIYVINEQNGKAYRKSIRIGRHNTDNYEILEGLSEGDRVIISDYSTFENAEELQLK